jgi:predicted ATPase
VNFQIFNVSIDGKIFEISKAISTRNNIISVLTGKNGSGKSKILEFIASNFQLTASFLQAHPCNWDEKFNDLKFDYSKNQILYKANERNITAKIINKAVACAFLSDEFIKDWKQVFPTKLVCVSTSPFDRFPLNNAIKSSEDGLYSYIGMKSARRNNSVKSLIANVVGTMFKKPSSIDANIEVIKTTLEYLGYGTRILVSYSKSTAIGEVFPITLERVTSILNKLKNEGTFDNDIETTKQEYCSKDVYESLIYLYEKDNFKNKKTFSIQLNLSKKNILENDYIKALQILSRVGFFKIKSLKLSEKKDNRKFIDFVSASSGEQCLALMLLGIASQIEDGSLICIDEPEISLHPEWQEEFIPLLEKLFSHYSGCHFIIATHSPLIISKLNSSSCFALDLDKNELVNLDRTTSRSSDYQLATLFKSPGFKNEYLVNECLDILSHLSKSINIPVSIKERAESLILVMPRLDEDDPVFSLISTIQRVLEEV